MGKVHDASFFPVCIPKAAGGFAAFGERAQRTIHLSVGDDRLHLSFVTPKRESVMEHSLARFYIPFPLDGHRIFRIIYTDFHMGTILFIAHQDRVLTVHSPVATVVAVLASGIRHLETQAHRSVGFHPDSHLGSIGTANRLHMITLTVVIETAVDQSIPEVQGLIHILHFRQVGQVQAQAA